MKKCNNGLTKIVGRYIPHFIKHIVKSSVDFLHQHYQRYLPKPVVACNTAALNYSASLERHLKIFTSITERTTLIKCWKEGDNKRRLSPPPLTVSLLSLSGCLSGNGDSVCREVGSICTGHTKKSVLNLI